MALSGEAFDLLDHDLFRERAPWDIFARLQSEAPVYWHEEPDGPGFWNVTRYDDIVTVLKDYRTFSSEIRGSASIADYPTEELDARRNFMELDPPRHAKYRGLLAKDFTPRSVLRYKEWLHGLIGPLVEAAVADGEFDVVERLSAPIPIRVLGHLMGLPEEHLDRLVQLGDMMLVGSEPEYRLDDEFPDADPEEYRFMPFGSPAALELCEIGRRYYADRRARPEDDVMSLLVNAEIDGCPMSGGDLDNTFALIVVAGNETTRMAIALGVLALAQHPEQLALLQSDPSLYAAATEEIMRFASPVWHFRRTALVDTELAGTTITAGDKVVVWFAAGNRDASKYPDPHRFDITRNPADSLTFGRGGPHFCLGAHLAKLELRVLLEELVPRVRSIELAGEPERIRSNFSNGLKRLPVRVVPAA